MPRQQLTPPLETAPLLTQIERGKSQFLFDFDFDFSHLEIEELILREDVLPCIMPEGHTCAAVEALRLPAWV
eukprot:1810487-Rhodomonas_salina.3